MCVCVCVCVSRTLHVYELCVCHKSSTQQVVTRKLSTQQARSEGSTCLYCVLSNTGAAIGVEKCLRRELLDLLCVWADTHPDVIDIQELKTHCTHSTNIKTASNEHVSQDTRTCKHAYVHSRMDTHANVHSHIPQPLCPFNQSSVAAIPWSIFPPVCANGSAVWAVTRDSGISQVDLAWYWCCSSHAGVSSCDSAR